MTYLEELKANLAKEQAAKQQQFDEQEQKVVATWQHAMTPLEQRLKRLLDDMPESVKANGVSLPVLQQMLKGRWRGNAHPGELGMALRKLGYLRTRSWRGDEIGFAALWNKL